MNMMLAGVVAVLNYILTVYLIVLFANAILRLVRADPTSPIVRMIGVVAAPPALWLVRKFPRLVVHSGMQSMDLSPAVLMIGIGCVKILLDHLYQYLRFAG